MSSALQIWWSSVVLSLVSKQHLKKFLKKSGSSPSCPFQMLVSPILHSINSVTHHQWKPGLRRAESTALASHCALRDHIRFKCTQQ